MFTGLIETIQPVISNVAAPIGRQFCIELAELAHDAGLGDSICVNGVCLTLSRLAGSRGWFDVMGETLKVSTLDGIKIGERVNLERAMAADGRFGGHIVQGHVDAIGTIDQIEKKQSQHIIWISTQPEAMDLMITKGSVAIDGVSLTIVEVEKSRFSVSLIPTTLNASNLGWRKKGDQVNLEADLVSKWIKKRLDAVLPQKHGNDRLTMEKLRDLGFA